MQVENKYIDQYTELITSVLAKEADQAALDKHKELLADEQYLALFKQFQKTWNHVSLNENIPEIDVEAEWNKINKTLFKEEEKVVSIAPKKKTNYLLRIAAMLAIGIFAVAGYIVMGKSKHRTIVAENTVVKQDLPDGSVVTLNCQSTIKYPKDYSKNNRKVELEGDAHFKVEPDKENPFTVEANNIVVRVLGTSFYVNTHSKKGKIEVIVETGVVEVYEKGKEDKKTILNKGEKATFEPSEKKVVKSDNQDINYLSWKTQKLKFENQELYLIVHDLNRAYHANVVIKSDEIKHCRLTVNFENKDLDAVLNILKEILDLKIKKKKGVIELKGKGCS